LRNTIVGLLAVLTLTTSAAARADGVPQEARWLLVGRLGAWLPRVSQDDDLLVERTHTLALQRSDWTGGLAGIECGYRAAGFLELGQGLDAQQGVIDRTPDSVSDTSRLFVETVTFGLTARLIPTGPAVRFAPYLAAGPDLVVWRYIETIGGAPNERKADGATLGLHAAIGIRLFVTHSVAFSAEYRRRFAGADMDGDFAGKHLDLTGSMVTLGVTYRF
jgi:opacity protein-like surface antigen